MATTAGTIAAYSHRGANSVAPADAVLSPYPTDYRSWKFLACGGLVFMTCFVFLWGVLAGNIPPFPPSASPNAVWQHYATNRLAIMIGMSVCLTITSFYMIWSVAISKVMERIEGDNGLWSKVEIMGGTITCAPIMVACAIWLTAAHEIQTISPQIAHMLYWFGWLLIDLAYMVTSFQIAGISIVFSRDKRAKKLVPEWVIWWGWVTFASFFVVSAIPFVYNGPLAFDGMISFWIAFFTWFIWCPSLSFYIIKAVDRLKAEDEAAGVATA